MWPRIFKTWGTRGPAAAGVERNCPSAKEKEKSKKTNVPLGKARDEVPLGTLRRKRGDAEPRGGAVIAGPAVAGDGVLDELAAGRGGTELGRRGEVTDDGDLCDVAAGAGAEGSGGGARGGADGGQEGAASEERHVCFGGGSWACCCDVVGVCGRGGLRLRAGTLIVARLDAGRRAVELYRGTDNPQLAGRHLGRHEGGPLSSYWINALKLGSPALFAFAPTRRVCAGVA